MSSVDQDVTDEDVRLFVEHQRKGSMFDDFKGKKKEKKRLKKNKETHGAQEGPPDARSDCIAKANQRVDAIDKAARDAGKPSKTTELKRSHEWKLEEFRYGVTGLKRKSITNLFASGEKWSTEKIGLPVIVASVFGDTPCQIVAVHKNGKKMAIRPVDDAITLIMSDALTAKSSIPQLAFMNMGKTLPAYIVAPSSVKSTKSLVCAVVTMSGVEDEYVIIYTGAATMCGESKIIPYVVKMPISRFEPVKSEDVEASWFVPAVNRYKARKARDFSVVNNVEVPAE